MVTNNTDDDFEEELSADISAELKAIDEFEPFKNNTQSITLGDGNGITFENGDEIVIYGDLVVDKYNKEQLKNIIVLLQKIVES